MPGTADRRTPAKSAMPDRRAALFPVLLPAFSLDSCPILLHKSPVSPL